MAKFRSSQCKLMAEVMNEGVRALKDALENLYTEEHIKKDSGIRNFVEKF